jgi:hypothetical protein
MSQHEVEVKPYGQKNEVETRSYSSGTSRQGELERQPPYGQKNESVGVTVTAQPTTTGSRSDVEVRPLGVDTSGLNKTTTRTATTTVQRPMQINWEQWKNPLLATLLGITLALSLLSLSYVPRAISGAWNWGTSWLPSMHHTNQKTYDTYEKHTKNYMHDLQPRGGSFPRSC